MRQMLLQNATAILLQNAREVYYKMCQVFYYKMRQLLQNATFIRQYMEHPDTRAITNLWVRIFRIFFLDRLIKGTTLDKALTLQLALLIISFRYSLKFNFVSTLIPSKELENYDNSLFLVAFHTH